MKPFFVLLAVTLGLASVGAVAWFGLLAPPPQELWQPYAEELPMPRKGPYGKAEISETTYDFGVNVVTAKDKHTFTIKNVGEGPLNLKLGKPSCQCTVGELTKVGADNETISQPDHGKIEPGATVSLAVNESVNILVKWSMGAEYEKFRQVVPVFTTDPDLRKMELAVQGKVENPIRMLPDRFWDLNELGRIDSTKFEGLVFSKQFDSFEIRETPRPIGRAKLTFEPAPQELLETNQAKSGYRVIVEVPPDIPVGTFRELIELKAVTDDPYAQRDTNGDIIPEQIHNGDDDEKPAELTELQKQGKRELTLAVTIAGSRTGPIEFRGPSPGIHFNQSSNRVLFNEFPAADGKKGTVMIFPKGLTEELKLLSVAPTSSRISFSLSPGKTIGNSKSYQLEIEILPGPPKAETGESAPTFELKLNHPEVPYFNLVIDYNAKS